MQGTATQEDISIYSSDPSGDKTQPPVPYYAAGVEVNYTAPGPWWNWLWNKITSILTAHKSDWNSMTTEMANLLDGVNMSPVAYDRHQMSRAASETAFKVCEEYNDAEEDGHKVNQPDVIGHTLYIPDTELL